CRSVPAGGPCPEHEEPLALFCEPCAAPLCALCRVGPEHLQHRVRPADEAARELRVRGGAGQGPGDWEGAGCLRCRGDVKSDDLLVCMTMVSEAQRVQDTFEELQHFLKEQKKILLAQLERVSQELVSRSDEYNSRVLERESLLDTVIAQIQDKREQPELEFLMVRLHRPLGAVTPGEAGNTHVAPSACQGISPELQRSIESLSETSQLVTLDPETASFHLTLSRDHKTVWLGDGRQNLPDTSKRFTGSPSVLGSQGFTSGRHYWELEVGKGESWAVGVALESVLRKDSLSVALGKIWALRLDWDGQYTALHLPPAPLALGEKLQRIRVHLDYEAGQVTFYNAENMTQILQFKASFTEKVFPYFWLWSRETHIQLCD
uniref:Tripartite motif-containing protein 15 n=1 Tax=Malurus cyaneus samueli TaxID=2593467 RepID=A0A8C5U2A8_9PASS